jgi:uncharacterized protein
MPEQNEIFTSYDGLTLQGTYASPNGEIKGTALLVHSGTASRDNGGFHPELAGKLLEIGVASFRIDYRGHGENTLPMEEITMYGVINDIDAANKHLRKLAGDNVTTLLLFATSFGGGLAAYWAAQNPGKIDQAFLLGPVIDYKSDILRLPTEEWQRKLKDEGRINYAMTHFGRALLNEIPHIDIAVKAALASPPFRIMIINGDDDALSTLAEKYLCKRDDCRAITLKGAPHGFWGKEYFNEPQDIAIREIMYQHVFDAIGRELSS